MAGNYLFRDLFCHSFELHRQDFAVKNNEIVRAMYEIQEGYSPPEEDSDTSKKHIDYNNPALRCAYLHKYAGCHASLVEHLLLLIHYDHPWILSNIFFKSGETKICCLGGGPGNDIIGISSALSAIPEAEATYFNFTVVDKMHAWTYAYESILMAAESGRYGRLGEFLSSRVSSSYHGADIVSHVTVPMDFIRTADIVTMIKFVSSVDSQDIQKILERVFDSLKPGALVLFIDNDAGGFYESVSLCASNCNLDIVFGPLRHYKYEDAAFKQELFGIYSLSRTTITVQMWRKADTASHIHLKDELTYGPSKNPYDTRTEYPLHHCSHFTKNKRYSRKKNKSIPLRRQLLANVYNEVRDNVKTSRTLGFNFTNIFRDNRPGDYGFFNEPQLLENAVYKSRQNYSSTYSSQDDYSEQQLLNDSIYSSQDNYSEQQFHDDSIYAWEDQYSERHFIEDSVYNAQDHYGQRQFPKDSTYCSPFYYRKR